MNREVLEKFISATYHADAEFPWVKYPNYTVFRHRNNQKWFALVLEVPKEKLGLSEQGMLDILNVKCDPIMIGSLRTEPGIYSAYHMNKESWVSVALDVSVNDEKIKMLLDISFELTAPKIKRRKMQSQN